MLVVANWPAREIPLLPTESAEIDFLPLRPFHPPGIIGGSLKESFFKSTDVSLGSRYAVIAAAPPVELLVDGKPDEWALPTTLSFGEALQVTAGRPFPDNSQMSPASVRCAANDDALVCAIDVKKRKRGWSQTRVGSQQWSMDSIEIFFRTRVTKVNWLDPVYRGGDIKVSFAQNSEKPAEKHISVDQGAEFLSTNGVEFAFADRSDGLGYTCEIRIPWSCFVGLDGKKPDYLGFDISLNASEEGESRTRQYTWSGTGENWKNTSRFGVVKLP